MIDLSKISNFNLTDSELEENILFWVSAAGKNGHTAARCLEVFLTMITYNSMNPFDAIRASCRFDKENPDSGITTSELMKKAGIGCYNHKCRTFSELAHSNLNLKTCTTEDLEKIYGIGMKTSRCFILHTRKDANCAGLDTHMLKYLRAAGYNAPISTPAQKKKYLTLEKNVLYLAEQVGMTPAEFDLWVWNQYAR